MGMEVTLTRLSDRDREVLTSISHHLSGIYDALVAINQNISLGISRDNETDAEFVARKVRGSDDAK